jgi:uncharacterized Rmd1/YagE family protein
MVPSLEQYISLIQKEDYDKAEILLHPMENTQNKAAQKPVPKDITEGAVFVEGQKFPSITAASNATGYSAEQLKKYTQNSEESGISVTSKIKKAV